jgi:hypothetical protein
MTDRDIPWIGHVVFSDSSECLYCGAPENPDSKACAEAQYAEMMKRQKPLFTATPE